ncbi:MAG: arabinogalactan endo-1,4-beta-galactosidase [Treponema sp.]|jgi:arabinogalactan endo-1,4-beta-galactosidase|nr:arabinogalactan endo-1,4-beta-galactosidase [Treponema sp.]
MGARLMLLAACGMASIATAILATACYMAPGEGHDLKYEALALPAIAPALGPDFMRGVDISMARAIEEAGGVFRDEYGSRGDIIAILKAHGVNWIRLRIWHNPTDPAVDKSPGLNNYARTLAMAKRAKAAGLKFLLDFHYSDTWADPGKQTKPAAWSNLAYADLKAALYAYTKQIVSDLAAAGAAPDMVQLGNEIPGGILWDDGKDETKLGELLSEGSRAVREAAPSARIMLHVDRGGVDFTWFFDRYAAHGETAATRAAVDFDVIGLSWYPYFDSHKNLSNLKTRIAALKTRYGKDVVVAETAYGWGLGYSDYTDNQFWTTQENHAAAQLDAVSDDGVLFAQREDGTRYVPASIANQALVTRAIMRAVKESGGTGLFYWAGDWISAPGIDSTWENQALFDLEGTALPSMAVFGLE